MYAFSKTTRNDSKGDTHVTKNSSIVSGLGILAFALIGFWSPFSVEIECHWYMAPNTRA